MAYEAAGALAYERLFHHAALSPALAASLDDGAAIDAARYDAAREDAKRIGASFAVAMSELDAVLAPAAFDEASLGLGATGDPVFCRPWTLLRLPCLTLPAGFGPHDMPIGVQLVARPRCDARLLAIARFVEAGLVMRKGKPPPPCARQDPQTSRPSEQGRPLGPSRPHNGE
jgi:Asp-tRNA(Asn)/Glu-tRNA(Gln) amidotransferase A subunit family amidase